MVVFGAKSSKFGNTKTALAAKLANFLCVIKRPFKNV
jgi:hypothetical protein